MSLSKFEEGGENYSDNFRKVEMIAAIIFDNFRTMLNYRCNSFLIGPMIQNTYYKLIG
jgi:hypothetical protein